MDGSVTEQITETEAAPAEQGQPAPIIENVVNRLSSLENREKVCLGDMVKAFGSATFVPALLVPALLVVSPLSGIPFFSTICGLMIALIAGQMVIRRKHLWLPNLIMQQELSGDALKSALRPAKRAARFIDTHSEVKWRILNRPPFDLLPELLCVISGLSMPFLEVVPFSSSTLGLAVACFSVGFIARDGRFTIAGIGIMALALAVPYLLMSAILT